MVDPKMKALTVLRKDIENGAVDVPRELLKALAERLMSAEADGLCGAGYGERSDERVNRRNGYRQRQWDTRVGSMDLGIPKLRQGSYYPHWLLEPRRRAERALTQVVTESYVLGVSTRRVDKLVQSMGIDGISKSEVSRLAQELDELVEEFRSRPLDGGPYTYVWLDAHTQRCREGGRIVNVATVVGIGVNADGQREVLGVDVFTTEDGAGWTAFLRSLTARGLSGVRLVVSDAHEGLKDAIGAVLPGASWQRCRTHFMRNLLTKVPKSSQQMVATLVRTIFSQSSYEETWKQQRRVVEQLEATFPEAAKMLDEASEDVLAYASLPREHWKQVWSNNPQERLNKELRRRTDVVGIFPNRPAIIRLVGAVLAEQHDEWAVARRYMSPELLAKARLTVIDGEKNDEEAEAISKLDAAS
jgi:transposase-like protein